MCATELAHSSIENLRSTVERHLSTNLNRYLEIFEQMVSINTFTLNPLGVTALAQYSAKTFADLGFTAELIPSVDSKYGSHLVLSKKGKKTDTIALVSHLDTVFPAEEEERNDFHWQVAGEKIYGPGTIDIKGGTVLIYMLLDALKSVTPEVYETYSWMIFLNAAEEHLVTDFSEICRSRFTADTKACLVFEAGREEESFNEFTLVTARKGRAMLTIEATGRNSHAGADHQRGANAIRQLAEIIPKIEALTDYSNDLTANIGTIRGGETVNRVPSHVTADMEMRAFDGAVLQKAIDTVTSFDGYSTVRSAADNYPCSVKVTLHSQESGWPKNEGTEKIFSAFAQAGSELGMTVRPESRGGLSDGSRLWNLVPTIDGLGPTGDNDHCAERSADGSKEQEYVLVGSLVPKSLLNVFGVLKFLGEI